MKISNITDAISKFVDYTSHMNVLILSVKAHRIGCIN